MHRFLGWPKFSHFHFFSTMSKTSFASDPLASVGSHRLEALPLLDSIEDKGLPTALDALLDPDPLSEFFDTAHLLPPKPEKADSSTISASGRPEYKAMMKRNFGGRGQMSALIYRALDFYFEKSGAKVLPDGKIVSAVQSTLVLGDVVV